MSGLGLGRFALAIWATTPKLGHSGARPPSCAEDETRPQARAQTRQIDSDHATSAARLRAAGRPGTISVMATEGFRAPAARGFSRARAGCALVGAALFLLARTTEAAPEDTPQVEGTTSVSSSARTITATDQRTSRPDWLAVQGGAVLFGVAYGAALVTAGQENFRDNAGWLAIPVGGPWLSLWSGTSVAGWALAADGIAQLGGGALVTMGFANPQTTLGPAQAGLQHGDNQSWAASAGRPEMFTLRGVF